MAKRDRENELDKFYVGDVELPESTPVLEVVDEPDLQDAIELKTDEVQAIIEKNKETHFIKMARLYAIRDYGIVVQNLETNEKRFVPNDNIYFATSEKRFAMTQEEFDKLLPLKGLQL
jgi:hypothetical protein